MIRDRYCNGRMIAFPAFRSAHAGYRTEDTNGEGGVCRLGRHGLPDGRASQGQGRPRRHRLQPHRRQGRQMGRPASAASSAPTPKAAARRPGFRHGLRRQRQRSARSDARQGRRVRRHRARARSSSTTPPPRRRSRASCTPRPRRRGFDFIDAPVSGGQAGAENGVLTVMCGGDAEPVRARRKGDRGLCARLQR